MTHSFRCSHRWNCALPSAAARLLRVSKSGLERRAALFPMAGYAAQFRFRVCQSNRQWKTSWTFARSACCSAFLLQPWHDQREGLRWKTSSAKTRRITRIARGHSGGEHRCTVRRFAQRGGRSPTHLIDADARRLQHTRSLLAKTILLPAAIWTSSTT